MTFTAGLLIGYFIGTTTGTVVMAFFCAISRRNDIRDDELAARRWRRNGEPDGNANPPRRK